MTVVYSPDVAPELQPDVVRWQPRSLAYERRATEQKLAVLAAATALCALAVGVVAMGALAIGRLNGGTPRVRALRIERRRGDRLRRPF